MARKLEITLDEVWAADAISDRCPPLVFAVVARALDCPELEHEATRLLVERDLPGQEVERVLTHLSSPALTDLERDLVSLARETVWGQPAQIQPKLHRLKDRLTREQLLEFAGMAALANAVCRLSVLGCEVA